MANVATYLVTKVFLDFSILKEMGFQQEEISLFEWEYQGIDP